MKAGLLGLGALLLLTACGEGDAVTERAMTKEEVATELSGLKIEPGLWETTSEIVDVTGPNLPVEVRNMMKQQASNTVRNCITPEQAEQPDANFLAAQQNSECTYRDFAMRGGRLTGTMVCTGGGFPGEMRAEMDGQYGPQSYDMRLTMQASGMPEGADMTIQTRTTGRRIGDCQGETQ